MHRNTSLIPRPLLPPVLDHFQYLNMELEQPGRSHHVSCNVRYTEGRQNRGEWPTKNLKDNLCNVYTRTHCWNIHKATPIQLTVHHTWDWSTTLGLCPSCAYPLYPMRHSVTTHNNISQTFSLFLDTKLLQQNAAGMYQRLVDKVVDELCAVVTVHVWVCTITNAN